MPTFFKVLSCSWKKATAISMSVTAIVGALFMVLHLARAGEPYWIAQRYWVVAEIKDETNKLSAQLAQSISINAKALEKLTIETSSIRLQQLMDQHRSIIREIDTKKLLLLKDKNASLDYRAAIEQQIKRLEEDDENVQRRIQTLRQQHVN